nr:hypothetical protein [uncultured Rhodopila sp.]
MLAQPNPLQRISFITFLDVIDRTDLLFHEIRQLQTTLIQQLGLPELFAVLRFEEDFLWTKNPGDLWLNSLRSEENIRNRFRGLAQRWTVRYPLPSDSEPDPNLGAGDEVLARNLDIRRHVWDVMQAASRHGYLTQDLRRIFFMTAELQVVKQNLLREKIVVVHAALRAFGLIQTHLQPIKLEPPSVRDAKRSDFQNIESARLRPLLLACWALRTQLALRVVRIGNIQRQIEQQIDVALEQDPRPSAARRRDQGIYNDAIVDRFLSLQGLMAEILKKLGTKNRFAVHYPDADRRIPPIIMHRWDLQNTSRWQHEIDAIHLDEAWDLHKPPLDAAAYNALRYLNSSYWMPDRPDMQPQLAHEIAHAELADLYAGPNYYSMIGASDPFAKLLNRINAAIEDFGRSANQHDIAWRWELTHEEIRTVLTEVGADLLATAAVGDAYLFTMALNVPGAGFEAILDGQPRVPDFDLDFEREIFERLPRVPGPPIWFLRLHAAIGFLRAIGKNRVTPVPLAATLVRGVRDAADLLYSAFRDGAVKNRRGAWDHWHALCLTIERITEEEDGYRIAREIVGLDEAEATIGKPSGSWVQIGELLRGPLLEREVLDAVPDRQSLETQFAELYLRAEPEPRDVSVARLFRWVFDVPWQFALISSVKLFPKIAATESVLDGGIAKTFLLTIHGEPWLGRHIFQLGVELWVWRIRKVRIRLEVCIRVLRAILDSLRRPGLDLGSGSLIGPGTPPFAALERWLTTSFGHFKQTPDDLLRRSARNWSKDANERGNLEDSEHTRDAQRKAADALADLLGAALVALGKSDVGPGRGTPEPDKLRVRLRLAQLRDYARWSGNRVARADDLTQRLMPTLMRLLGHNLESGKGRSRIYRLQRIATRAHVLPLSARIEFGQQRHATFSSGQRELFASPWVDAPANRDKAHFVRCLPLLGRYDLIRIEEARTVGPGKLPRLSVHSQAMDSATRDASGREAGQEAVPPVEFEISGALPIGSGPVVLPLDALRPYKQPGGLTAKDMNELEPLSHNQNLEVRALWWNSPYVVEVVWTKIPPYRGIDGRFFSNYIIASEPIPLPDDPRRSTLPQANREYDEPFFIRQQFGLPFRREWLTETMPPWNPVEVQAKWNALVAAMARRPPDAFTADRHAARSEWFITPGEKAPMAVLSTQLAQRSARLTFLRQIAHPGIKAERADPWGAFRLADPDRRNSTAGDDGFIIDGWGDIVCVFNIDSRETDRPGVGHLLPTVGDLVDTKSWVYDSEGKFSAGALTKRLKRFHKEVARRLTEIIHFKNACYDHFLVARTELAFTTFAGDAALRTMLHQKFGGPQDTKTGNLDWSFQCRIRPDRASGLYNLNFVNQVTNWSEDQNARAALTRRARTAREKWLDVPMPIFLVRQAGVLDYRISIMREPKGLHAMDQMLFGENGALVDAYETLARDLGDGQNICREVLEGRVFIPATALMMSSMLAGEALEAIDHRFTTLGIAWRAPDPPLL